MEFIIEFIIALMIILGIGLIAYRGSRGDGRWQRVRPRQGPKYLDKVLQPGEQVEYQTRLHPIIFFPSFLVFFFALMVVRSSSSGSGLGAILLALLALVLFLKAWIARVTTEMAITSRRVIYKTGWIRRDTIEMNRDKIESVDVSQSVLGRMFDFGTVTVRGTGQGIEPLRNIEAPLTFRRFVAGQ